MELSTRGDGILIGIVGIEMDNLSVLRLAAIWQIRCNGGNNAVLYYINIFNQGF
jgi:hypothetical protein